MQKDTKKKAPARDKRITRFVLKQEEAEAIAEELITDLKRQGLLGVVWWREVLPQTKEEIKQRWARIIQRRCNKFARKPQWQDAVSPEVIKKIQNYKD